MRLRTTSKARAMTRQSVSKYKSSPGLESSRYAIAGWLTAVVDGRSYEREKWLSCHAIDHLSLSAGSTDVGKSHTRHAVVYTAQQAETGLIRRADQGPIPFEVSYLAALVQSVDKVVTHTKENIGDPRIHIIR